MLLGMGISQNPEDHSIKLFQTAYIDSLLKKHGLEDANPDTIRSKCKIGSRSQRAKRLRNAGGVTRACISKLCNLNRIINVSGDRNQTRHRLFSPALSSVHTESEADPLDHRKTQFFNILKEQRLWD